MHHVSLTEKFRPRSLEEFLGQTEFLSKNGIIHRSIERKMPANLLFWGPPGSGKTSLAKIYIRSFSQKCIDLHVSHFQTVVVKKHIEEAASSFLFRPAIFWIDEIHRLTRPQQDLLLKAVEEGTVVIVGATTENPSFALSNALLSRIHVLNFSPLKAEHLEKLFHAVLSSYPHITFAQEAQQGIIEAAGGDARKFLNILEQFVQHLDPIHFTYEDIKKTLSSQTAVIGAIGEGRYFFISALHKAVRGSDPQAAIYWISRLFHAGEDPLYVSRRLIRMATEDIGLADPQALSFALSAHSVYQTLGSPEGELALVEVAIYLALAPKSAAAYAAFSASKEMAKQTAHLLPPKHILNAPTQWMKQEGFSQGYIYDHEVKDAFSGQNYFPEELGAQEFYQPVERGFERELRRRIDYFSRLKKNR